MAISILGTTNVHKSPASTEVSLLDGNHATTSDTTLLLNFVAIEGAEEPNPTNPSRFDISGTDQALTLISDSLNTGSNGDVRTLIYGLVNPGAVAVANCRFSVQFSAFQIASVWVNVGGSVSTSVAAATNDIDQYSDTTGTGNTTVLTSGGSTGNSLFGWGAAQSNATSPSSVSGSFVEMVDSVTAATSSDLSFNLSRLLSGAPSGLTITWNSNNENAGNLIEVIPVASTNLLPDYSGTRGIMRGVGRGT